MTGTAKLEIPPLRSLVDTLKSAMPDTYARFNPRTYKNVDKWCDPRYSTLSLTSVIGLLETTPLLKTPIANDSIAKAHAVLGANLLKYNVPQFFVERELLKACLETNPPKSIAWKEIPLPFPSMIFILPRNSLFFSDGTEINYIAFGKLAAGRQQITPLNHLTSPLDIFFLVTESTAGFCLHHTIHDDNYTPPSFDEVQHTRPEDLFSMEMNLTDHETGLLLVKIVFNLLYAMAARPELTERGNRLKKHKKADCELWTPNVVGGKYRVKRESTEAAPGTHSSPRLHWRSGHLRNQHFGAGNLQTKTIWIEPILVGGK